MEETPAAGGKSPDPGDPNDANHPIGLRQVPEDNQETLCKLCFRSAKPEGEDGRPLDLGALYEYVVDPESEIYCAHYYCLLFSSGLDQNGDEELGIKGFLTSDILREWRRGQRLKCFYCNKSYATVGCNHKSCRKSYHLPCAVEHDSLQQFCGEYASYCSDHKPEQAGNRHALNERAKKNDPVSCGVCLEDMTAKDDLLWSPCCHNWYHRRCISSLADTTGYFFKCPLCNNKDVFEEEMKRFGIFVPEQDAAWERESGAFESLLERHGSCDAEMCACPEGREYDMDYTDWEIVLCKSCGAQGIHINCGGIVDREKPKWTCPDCTQILSTLPRAMTNKYVRLRGRLKVPKKGWRGKKSKIISESEGALSGEKVAQISENVQFLTKQKFCLSPANVLSTDRANLIEVSLDLDPWTAVNTADAKSFEPPKEQKGEGKEEEPPIVPLEEEKEKSELSIVENKNLISTGKSLLMLQSEKSGKGKKSKRKKASEQNTRKSSPKKRKLESPNENAPPPTATATPLRRDKQETPLIGQTASSERASSSSNGGKNRPLTASRKKQANPGPNDPRQKSILHFFTTKPLQSASNDADKLNESS